MPEQREGHFLGPNAYIPIITVKSSLLLLDNDHIIIQNISKREKILKITGYLALDQSTGHYAVLMDQ